MGIKHFGLEESSLTNMQERHAQTLSSIKELQNIEKQLYSQLNLNVASNTPNKFTQEQIITRINELSQMRIDLFNNLQDMYKFTQDNVVNSRNNLVQELTNVKIVENELNDAKKNLDQLKQNKYNKLRMVEINTYQSEYYKGYINLFKIIIYVLIPIVILGILVKSNIIPDNRVASQSSINNILISCMVIAFFVGGYYVLREWYDLSMRDNMNFNEYRWDYDPSLNPTVIQYDKTQLGMIGRNVKQGGQNLLKKSN